VAELAGEQKAQRAFCEERTKMVEVHDRALYGNGTEGLVTRMVKNQTTVDSIKESQQKATKWMRSLVGMVVLSLLGMLSQVIDFHAPDVGGEHIHTETPDK
jgi:hypothetical protein